MIDFILKNKSLFQLLFWSDRHEFFCSHIICGQIRNNVFQIKKKITNKTLWLHIDIPIINMPVLWDS